LTVIKQREGTSLHLVAFVSTSQSLAQIFVCANAGRESRQLEIGD
jgi:hypothetical protein